MAFWTRLHAMTVIPAFMVFLGCAVVLARIFRNETETMKLLPIRIIAVVLVFIEIIKQWQSVKDGYSLYHLPFHFCSMFVFLFPVFAFYMGKHKQ